MRTMSRTTDESGVALITALLVVMLISGLMAGMFAALTSDQRSHAIDRDQSQAYAAAHAGLEKLTASLARLFETDVSPSGTQINATDDVPPTIAGFTYTSPGGTAGSGYAISFTADPGPGPNTGNPMASPSNDITTGPFTGFKGLITPYTLTVTARSAGGSEVRLRREMQTVAVPVFQFGIFGEKNLSFHPGSNFTFGGRVHTNGNLFLAANTGATLTLGDKVTAVGQVIRQEFENTVPLSSSGYTGSVSVPVVIGSSSRNLAATEGSVTGGPGSSAWGGWKNLSEATYLTNIRTTLTGAKRLDLPLVSQGARPIDIIRRPDLGSNENVTNAPVFGQRFFSQASLRILLSDRVADITGLPTVTATAPVALDATFVPPAGMPPVARSIGPNSVAITGTGGTGSTSTGTISFAALPDWLKAGGVAAAAFSMAIPGSTVTGCTAMTATTLTGCTVTATTPANTDFTYTLPNGEIITLRTGVASTPAGAGGGKTVTLVSTRDLAVGARIVWAGNTALTCTGYTAANQLNGCYWTTVPSGAVTTHARSNAGESLLGGFIKIERQSAAGAWTDVTTEILNLGFSATNQEGAAARCPDPTPNAVIRLQRLRDNATAPATAANSTTACGTTNTILATDYWPNNLFDAREATYRDIPPATTSLTMGGIINYVTLDVGNLKKWLNGTTPGTGNLAVNNNGYIVYFSDRRGNHNDAVAGAPETGEYGNEDSINLDAAGTANGVLDPGEDRNENSVAPASPIVPLPETYGAIVSTVPGVLPTGAPVGNVSFGTTATPLTTVTNNPEGRVNRQVLFRRALKLANGCIGVAASVGGCNPGNGVNSLPDSGLTVAAENAVYVQGNYNATNASATVTPNRPAAVIADAIMILSNSWTDAASLRFPHDYVSRVASNTGYRFAMIAGKSIAFPHPTWAALWNWGTDGGTHNFMRMLEDWNGRTAYYRGSMVSLYTARQFTGIFKNNSNTYRQPTRAFTFDTDFLTPTLLPPGTPMFRDVNTLRFRQILRPNQ